VRRGTAEVLRCLLQKFPHVILSTWEGELLEGLPLGRCHVIRNRRPSNGGYSNRNYQRLSVASGVDAAERLGCTHVLKWRTDMLPTRLDVDQLLVWAHYKVPPRVQSRVVTSAFRNLTVGEDWFSSMPDLFAFAHIGVMKLLWGAESFDFSRSANLPPAMLADTGCEWLGEPNASSVYCSESELYAWFKHRLQSITEKSMTHLQIARDYMYLIHHDRLKICWFDAHEGFRSITQALQHPWWTERTWQSGRPIIVEKGYPEHAWWQRVLHHQISPRVAKLNALRQSRWYRAYLAETRRTHGQ
jgi:hypothetical protein